MAKVIFTKSKVETEVPDGSKLTEVCEKQGIMFACYIGVCGTCVVSVEEGMELVQKGRKSQPDRPFLLQLHGWGCYKQGKQEEALQFLKMADEGRMGFMYNLDQKIREVEKAIQKTHI